MMGEEYMPPLPIVIALAALASFVGWDWISGPPSGDGSLGRDLARFFLSGVVLLAALLVILSKRYVPTDRHWGYGTLGILVGFWLGGGATVFVTGLRLN
jgi:hypothetical protein